MRRYFALLLLILTPWALSAQILNIEKERTEDSDSTKWMGNLGANFTLQNQQVQSMIFSLNSNLTYYGTTHAYIMIGELEMLKGNGSLLESQGYGHIRTNLFHKKRLSYELFGQIQYDQVRGMQQRYLGGGGVRYALHSKEKVKIAIGTGAMFEHEGWEWTITENEVDETLGWNEGDVISRITDRLKNNTYCSVTYDISDETSINCIVYYQAMFETLDEPRISSEFNFQVGLSEHMKFNLMASLWHDAAPVVPIKQTNYTIENGVVFSF
ncbi:DUF481 domain-containing protein [Limibacter armeniacum]|uniref:DUF481 domain-containing protein n=1 Tax=Limibacter armeniacum TaxID=466084 RepID=UPI002FE55177